MSGSHYDYQDMYVFGLMIDKTDDTDLVEILKIVQDWVHAYDWCISGDTNQETYLQEKAQAIDRIKVKLNQPKTEE